MSQRTMGTQETMEGSLKAVVRVFRRECHRVLDSERTTIHGADNMLMVLQLAAAEVCKQERGDFGVALSDVLVAWKCLLLDKLHLSHDGSPLSENYDLIRKEYDSFLKRTNTVDLIDIYNMYKQLRRDEDPEDPLTAMQLFEFLHGTTEAFEETGLIPPCPATPSNRAQRCISQVQRVVRRVFCSYLGLLVNTKNDLALAHTLNAPSRSLGHRAFTDLKRAARSSATSLFLASLDFPYSYIPIETAQGAVTSFVRAVQLGGKGYAPSPSDPLRKHIKGLSQFVHFTDQLEEILGESPNPSLGPSAQPAVCSVMLDDWLEHPHTVPADGAVGVEVEGHQAFWTCDNKPFISVLTTVPPHTDSLGVSTKTKAGLVTEDDPLPF
ncbi:hypothetical protein NFI96_005159 [Prochilodus magdalenae]|nr:hypothetical protein NFI96_005159 [Prochilodus magdalenae]